MKDNKIKQLLEKYKFTIPIPAAVQKKVLKAKKRSLIAVYKKNGKYSLFVLLCINVYFLIKRIGISITFAKVYFLMSITAVIFCLTFFTALVTGAYFYFFKEEVKLPEKVKETVNIIKEPDKNEIKKPVVKKIRYKVAVLPFEFQNDVADTARNARKFVKNELVAIKGKSIANYASQIKNTRSNYILMGSVIKLGDKFRVSIKLVDKTSTKVIFYASEQAANDTEILTVCKNLSRKVAVKL